MNDQSKSSGLSKCEKLIERYEEFHQHSTNRLIHFFCVPAIALSLIGLLWSIKIADVAIPTTEYFLTLNVGAIFICLAALYYLTLSVGSFLGMVVFGLMASLLCISFEMSPYSLLMVSLVMFVLAWVGQFIGHHMEGKRPAFTEDIQFLLVSPAWLLDVLYKNPLKSVPVLGVLFFGSYLGVNQLFAAEHVPDFSASLKRADQYEVKIIRDKWGVPHVIGKTDADVAYGLAYAHAEDDFKTIEQVILAARGKLASVEGIKAAPNDYYVHLTKIWEGMDERFVKLDPELQSLCQGYADGLNLYASRNRDLLIPSIWPAKPQDLIAGFVHKLPLFIGLHRDIGRLMKPSDKPQKNASVLNPGGAPVGSNFLAVSPSRSADQATRVCINTHQPWTGPVSWYEAHLVTDKNNVYGGLFPGSPVILSGHNENITWGHTVNQPDLVDIFELEINPNNKNQYKVDGKWLELEQRVAPIEVKLIKDYRLTVKRELLYSIFGPSMRVGEKVYAIRYGGMDQFRQLEQWWRMGRAKNLGEFKEAMRVQALSMFNTGYADKEGNIFYVYNGLIPKRALGHDWSGTLEGNRRDLIWDEYIPFDDLPQVENPAAGFLQNCNSNPFQTTLGDGNPDEEKFDPSCGIEKEMTNRARRALELFGGDKEITREEFFAYKYDKSYAAKSNFRKVIGNFIDTVKLADAELQEELELIRDWDGSFDKANRSAALVLMTFRPRSNAVKLKFNQDKFLENLRETSKALRKNFGRVDVEWGKVNRLVRGVESFPLGGASDTLRAIYGEPQKDGTLSAKAGDCFIQFVEWDKNGKLQSWAIHQFGSATVDSKSPHYSDQSPLFSEEKERRTWFKREEVLANAKRVYKP